MKKNMLKSKTFWFGVLTSLLPLFPNVSKLVSENPTMIPMGWGILTVILRKLTKGKVVLLG